MCGSRSPSGHRDLPNMGAGQQGGPLHLNWEQARVGNHFDFYVGGFLYKK